MTQIRQWPYAFALGLSIVVGAAAVVSSLYLDVPLKDPDGFLGPSFVRLPLMALLIIGAGLVVDALRRSGWRQLPTAIREVVKEEWNAHRFLCIGAGLLSFYICYIGYRNLKNVLPIFREGTLFDQDLLRFDHWLSGGHDPAMILHGLFGTDIMAEFLSVVYLSYLPLVPISLGVVLIFSRNLAIGAWYSTTLCLNWVLGTVSYYILPSLGPVFTHPSSYSRLPETGVSELQEVLLDNRLDFLAAPATSESIQGVAAFASLHVSVTFAAALFLERTARKQLTRTVAWIFFGVTVVATLYFGWHYIADDIAGMVIGWTAVTLGARVTGNWPKRRRQPADLVDTSLPDRMRPKLDTAELTLEAATPSPIDDELDDLPEVVPPEVERPSTVERRTTAERPSKVERPSTVEAQSETKAV